MPKFLRGLYWGRFNPPHSGHLQVIKHLLARECSELVVAIGSALASHEPRNPFTGGERLLMLKAMLEEAGLAEKCVIVQVPDVVGSYAATANNVLLLAPKFDVVFTNRKVIADLFTGYGFAVKSFPDFEKTKYSSTNVREAMLGNKSWKQLVPPAVAEWLEENGGVQRMRLVEEDRYAE